MKVLTLLATLLLFTAPRVAARQLTDNTLSGTVVDSATGKPLSGVSVFLNNTSRGVVTRDDGSFVMENIPRGTYDLVISAISYSTYVITINGSHPPPPLKVVLHHQAEELTAVTVAPDLRHGWRDWGKFFIENFIGKTPNARHCRILNRKVLRFYYSAKNQRLSVRATEPLLVRNDALGYVVEFRLESFVSDFRSNIVSYFGYPFFREMETTSKGQRQKWQKNRETAYTGSIMHFMRSLYAGRATENKFITLREIRTGGERRRVMIRPDSLLTTHPDQTKTFFFAGKLTVTYEPFINDYLSTFEITGSTPITVEENGQYYPPDEVLTSGYWGRTEKVSNLLPLDYETPKH